MAKSVVHNFENVPIERGRSYYEIHKTDCVADYAGKVCGGAVLVFWNPNEFVPDRAYCVRCGQRYTPYGNKREIRNAEDCS